MLSIETIAVLIIGYLIGSIPWAVIVAKRAGVDIFSVGSGNPVRPMFYGPWVNQWATSYSPWTF